MAERFEFIENPIKWSAELLEFQNQNKVNGFSDLRILCDDGHFMVHRIVFAMCSSNPLKIERNLKVMLLQKLND